MNQDVTELAKKRAADLGLSIGNYLARLVQDDASGPHTRAVDAAARFLSEHQAVFDEAEDATASGSARRVMELHIDVPWIPQVAEVAGADDPAPDDYGVPSPATGPNSSSSPSTTAPTPKPQHSWTTSAGAAGSRITTLLRTWPTAT